MVLPEGMVLPPTLYLLGLGLALGVVLLGLVRLDPPVTTATVIALAPWMAAGGALHAIEVGAIVGPTLAPLLAAPAVYATTSVLAGVAWLLAAQLDIDRPTPWLLGGVGVGAFAVATAVVVAAAVSRGVFSPGWPVVGVAVSVVLSGAIWVGVRRALPSVAATTGWTGVLMVFGHVLDAVSTTIGVDVLGAGERSPVPLFIMEQAGRLPVADAIGVGWAFLVVKVALAVGILWLFADFIREDPRRANLLLAALIAVGMGPGVHNLLLFAMAG